MTFDAIPIRMLQLGVDRDWLCRECDYSSSTLASVLAPKGSNKTNKALRRIWEALDREEARQLAEKNAPEPPTLSNLVIRVETEEFDEWCRAALSRQQIISEWAVDAIRSAYREETAQPAASTVPMPTRQPDQAANVIELPFYGTVAAGLPGGPLDIADGTLPVPADIIGKHDPASLYLLRVNGRSMEPQYPDGSRVLCRKLETGEFAKKGDDVIASDSSGAYFKRLEYRKSGSKGNAPRKPTAHLVSLNPEFPEVTPASDCPIVAVVVGLVD